MFGRSAAVEPLTIGCQATNEGEFFEFMDHDPFFGRGTFWAASAGYVLAPYFIASSLVEPTILFFTIPHSIGTFAKRSQAMPWP